eukprot:g2361.t1
MLFVIAICSLVVFSSADDVYVQKSMKPCAGDTRGDMRCNHDSTHRVCAEIGLKNTSFWRFTGQRSWCGSSYQDDNGGSCPPYDSLYCKKRCPENEPTWCICKWATANWIKGQTCDDSITIDCEATDICYSAEGLFFSYKDFNVDLHPAHDCVAKKCSTVWKACAEANSHHGNANKVV